MLGDSVRRRLPQRRAGDLTRRPTNWKVWLIGVPVALVVPFVLGYFIAVRVLFPPPEVTSAGIIVPDLIGRDAIEAGRLVTAAGLGALEPTELPHPTAPSGQVIAQSPLPGQQLRSGATVLVAVSGGRPRAAVPYVIGFSAERATDMLQRSGFTISQTTQESDGPMGRVLRTDPIAGEVRQLPATVTLVVSIPIPIDTLRVDTLGPGTTFAKRPIP